MEVRAGCAKRYGAPGFIRLPVACASAEGVWQPTIAGASWTSSSFSRVSTMNRAKSTRRVICLDLVVEVGEAC